ncbi:glycosyltransferase family 4 protein [Rhodocista pekingensis]|uniref:Glycosyltransferase family 4 protein n=1 Tax=Rhodocista pekingensis TaxID=201185 RepID=A0ABW2L169_9PROT
MRILFVHQNFPAQYLHLAPALAARGHQCVALGMRDPVKLPGVQAFRYAVGRGSSTAIHPWVSEFETKVIRGEGVLRACEALKKNGFVPDVICVHPGWGEALFLREVFPTARILAYHEFYYAAEGQDVGFDPEFPMVGGDALARLHLKNTHLLLSLHLADAILTPTEWQGSTLPAEFRPKLRVVHDGVNTDTIRPDPGVSVRLSDGTVLTTADPVVTFVARNLEPMRGFHSFARCLPALQKARPDAQILVIGGDEVSYGAKPQDGVSYKERFMREVEGRIDPSRIHFLGRVPYGQFIGLLQLSSAHVYLTYPFVLSWSLLESMAAGALVVGSATPPVQEVVEHGRNGLLVDFFDPEAIAATVAEALDRREELRPLRAAARDTVVRRFDLNRVCLPRHIALVEALGSGQPLPIWAG